MTWYLLALSLTEYSRLYYQSPISEGTYTFYWEKESSMSPCLNAHIHSFFSCYSPPLCVSPRGVTLSDFQMELPLVSRYHAHFLLFSHFFNLILSEGHVTFDSLLFLIIMAINSFSNFYKNNTQYFIICVLL